MAEISVSPSKDCIQSNTHAEVKRKRTGNDVSELVKAFGNEEKKMLERRNSEECKKKSVPVVSSRLEKGKGLRSRKAKQRMAMRVSLASKCTTVSFRFARASQRRAFSLRVPLSNA